MKSLPEARIGDVCRLVNGRAFKPTDWGKDGLPIVRIQNLNNLNATFNYFNGEVRKQFLIDTGELLFSWSGTPGTSFGAFFWQRGRAVLNQHIFRVLVDSAKVDKNYFRYALNSRINHIIDQSHGGVGLKHITKGKLEATKVPFPTLEEQKRIAEILDKADAIRRSRQKAIALTEELLRSTFLDMFGDPVTNPKGWIKKPLGSLCKIVRGGSPRPINDYLGGTIPWIKIGDGTGGDKIYIHKTAEAIKKEGVKKSRYLEPGALIFANCGVSLGFARILQISGCIHDGWLAFSDIDKSLNQIFLLKLLNSITEYFRAIAPDGT